MAKKRLVWQIFPFFFLITVLSIIAIGLFISISLRQSFYQERIDALRNLSYSLERTIAQGILADNYSQIDSICKELGERADTRFSVILPSGQVIGDSHEEPLHMDNHSDRPEIKQALSGSIGKSTRFSYTIKALFFYVAIPIMNNSAIIGVLRASVPFEKVSTILNDVYLKLILAGLSITIIAGLLSLFLSRRLTKVLMEISNGAQNLATGNLSHRLAYYNVQEFDQLIESMNQMAIQLEDKINTIDQQNTEKETIFQSMTDGVFVVANNETIVGANDTALHFLRISKREELIGKTIHEIIRNAALLTLIIEVLNNPQKVIKRELVISHNGDRHLQVAGSVLRDKYNSPIGAIIILNDITSIRQADNIRREFVANASHELKTPVTAIQGLVETVLDGTARSKQDIKRFLEIVLKHTKRLHSIIEDMLTLSKLEAEEGYKTILKDNYKVITILRSVINTFDTIAKDKNIKLVLDCDEDLSFEVNASLIEQAVSNMVDNAIKYSPANSKVRVSAYGDNSELVISAKDQGEGIPEGDLLRLFERFYRVDKTRDRKMGGTGLGLAIVKHVALVHQGRVSVTSTLGQGSEFCIHLPIKQ